MSNHPPVTHCVDSEGIAWITFDEVAARANVLNSLTLAALQTSLKAVAALCADTPSAVKALIVISAKERIFLAGADLKWLAALPDVSAAASAARDGQAVFNRLAEFKVPVVCAIHGACAGGGYELALACTWRVASDSVATRLGLPEIGIGLIPGWGGSTRLPRLIGAQRAVEFILKAALVPAAAALTAGLIDELVPASELRARATAAALRLAKDGAPARPAAPVPAADFFLLQRQRVQLRRRGQPAGLALLEVVEQSAGLPLAAALELEANRFGQVAAGAVAKNLMRVFQLKEAARKQTLDGWFPALVAAAPPVPFRTIGIVGAGVMGSGLAHWCAAHGYGVILCDSSRNAVQRGVTVIRGLFAEGVQRGKVSAEAAHRMIGGVGITMSLEDFELCDLVIEAIVDDVTEKQKLFTELAAIVTPDCVLASTSSVLRVEEWAAPATLPERVIGLHFVNPVSRLPLVEVGLGPCTSRATVERALGFVKSLGKTAVLSRSSSGSFVTRVLAFYLHEACRLWELGVPTVVLDRAMHDWGWPMGPMRLIDEIGVDVTAAIFGEMARCFPERFTPGRICGWLLAADFKGRKNGTSAGFYDYVEGKEELNLALAKFVPESPGAAPAWEDRTIQDRLNGVMIDEANRAVAEGVVKTADDADLALLCGIGFPVFRGGLLHYAKGAGCGAV